MNDYLAVNRSNWDDRAPIHANSEEYELKNFIDDPQYLSKVIRFDQDLLGSVDGLKGLHLQCHIGTDTLSLARLGATMTGLDLSPESLKYARKLAYDAGVDIEYVESDVYSATDVLPLKSFDFIYTSIGVLAWLPSVQDWAKVIAALLKPGGRFFIRETHPIASSLVERNGEFIINYPYFELAEPLIEEADSSYVESDQKIESGLTHEWFHGTGEIISALIDHGLTITSYVEHKSLPWRPFESMSFDSETGEYSMTENQELFPLSFTLQASKPE